MNFSAWSIRNPIAPILAFFMLLVLGWQSFNTLPITRFPNIDVPLVAVTVTQNGAAPAELEMQVTREIEDAVAGITGVKNIISTVNDGVSTTAVEFRMEVPTDKAVQDVKDAIDRISGNLPADIDKPVVTRIDVEGQAIMTFAVASADMSIEELSWFVDDKIKRELQSQPGIGRIDRYGGADREIRIELDPVMLNSNGMTAADVNRQIRATNADLGSGRGEIGAQEQAIRTLGDAESAATPGRDDHRPAERPPGPSSAISARSSTPTRSCVRSRASTAARSSPSQCSAPRVPAKSASPRSSTTRLPRSKRNIPKS